jgi:glutathione S-transferase
MILYTCGQEKRAPALHPCGRAARALDEEGHRYDLRTVAGYRLLPWTRSGMRQEIRRLSGQEDVPILVLDDGSVITGTRAIIRWARSAAPAHTMSPRPLAS